MSLGRDNALCSGSAASPPLSYSLCRSDPPGNAVGDCRRRCARSCCSPCCPEEGGCASGGGGGPAPVPLVAMGDDPLLRLVHGPGGGPARRVPRGGHCRMGVSMQATGVLRGPQGSHVPGVGAGVVLYPGDNLCGWCNVFLLHGGIIAPPPAWDKFFLHVQFSSLLGAALTSRALRPACARRSARSLSAALTPWCTLRSCMQRSAQHNVSAALLCRAQCLTLVQRCARHRSAALTLG